MNAKESRRQFAFTLIEVLIIIVTLAALWLLLFSGIPGAIKESRRKQCSNNLRQAGIALRGFGLDIDGSISPMTDELTKHLHLSPARLGEAYLYFLVRSNELNSPKELVCPADPTRKPAASFTAGFANTNVSYFVGIDAWETAPRTMFAGDPNFTVAGRQPASGLLEIRSNTPVAWTTQRHKNQGNILFGDGSVQGSDSAKLRMALASTGFATNRLAMP